MLIGKNRYAFSLVESVIAIFLLSFAALSVLSLTQAGFVAQKRNQEIARANLVVQSVIADMRLWAEDINNYKGSWGPYNRTFSPPGYPDYNVKVRSQASGRTIYSPCAELETQWKGTDQGRRSMPDAVIPVEVTIAWSSDFKDSITVMTYVGEPKRNINGIQFEVLGPSSASVAMNYKSHYDVRAKDASGRYLDNLMFQWTPDVRYLSTTEKTTRDGRHLEVKRDQIVKLPDVPAPKPPAVSLVTCYARYGGTYLQAPTKGLLLP